MSPGDPSESMTSSPAARIVELTHRFGSRLALDRISFDVEGGTVFGLLGPNGGGKTTLFRILATLLRPDGGEAFVDGASVLKDADRVRGAIGVVFQRPALDGKLTVGENLWAQGRLYGMGGQRLTSRMADVLARFRIEDRRGERVERLSGGLQRRVELAKAMLHGPRVLLMDEPSSGLDPGARADLMAAIHELRDRDGVTTLLTTHLMDEADRCDRVAIIDAGALVVLDSPAALKQSFGGDVLRLTGARPEEIASRLRERFGGCVNVVDGVVRMERDRGHELVPQVIEALPGLVDSVTVGRPTLEDVFLRLTGHRL